MELKEPKIRERLWMACRRRGIQPALAERYSKCYDDFLLFVKQRAGGRWVDPNAVGRETIEAYLADLGSRRGLAFELQLLAFDVLAFLYAHVLDKPNVVVDQRQAAFKRFSERISELHYSPKTEKTYWHWCLSWMTFAEVKPWVPWATELRAKLVTALVEEWLTSLAIKRYVTANTQNLAMQSVLFLAKQVVGVELKGIDALRAKRPETLPEILSREQVLQVLDSLSGSKLVQAMLGYGCGCRVSEAVSLRVKDVLFDRKQIIIRDAKGRVDRIVPLPIVLMPLLKQQIEDARRWHLLDLKEGLARVPLPGAFHVKSAQAESSWEWFWIFPSEVRSKCPKTGRIGRYHVDESGINRTLNVVGRKLGLAQRLHFHILRHCFATHMLDSGVNVRQVQKLLAHKSLETTMRYTHVSLTGPASERSPLDTLQLMQPQQPNGQMATRKTPFNLVG